MLDKRNSAITEGSGRYCSLDSKLYLFPQMVSNYWLKCENMASIPIADKSCLIYETLGSQKVL